MRKVLVLISLVLIGCLPAGSPVKGIESGTEVGNTLPDPSSTICDPFNPEGNGSSLFGLKGRLYYLNPDQPRYESVSDYIAHGQTLDDMILYMNRLYVPTRPFDRGFVTVAGETLRTQQGDTLYEYFGMRLNSQLVLKNEQAAGAYQLALLSDDGAVLSINSGNGFQPFINNDQVHPTRMKCATSPIQLSQNSRIPIQLDYFQGPRFHISLILMWRPWVEGADMTDPLCEHTSNSDFFDSTQDPPVAGWAYQQLFDRGWRPLEVQNYLIEDGINPCNEEDF